MSADPQERRSAVVNALKWTAGRQMSKSKIASDRPAVLRAAFSALLLPEPRDDVVALEKLKTLAERAAQNMPSVDQAIILVMLERAGISAGSDGGPFVLNAQALHEAPGEKRRRLIKAMGLKSSHDQFVKRYEDPAFGRLADRLLNSDMEAAAPLAAPPRPIRELVGREAVVAELAGQVQAGQVVTVFGEGGQGKTEAVLAVAEALKSRYVDGVHWLALEDLDETTSLAEHAVAALGLTVRPEMNAVDQVAAAFMAAQALLVIDGAEHVAEDVASLVY